MNFDPVWVSTVEHLTRFKSINADTADAIRSGFRYNVPEKFPQTRMAMFFGLAYSSPSPLIMFSNGILDIDNNKVSYKAYQFKLKNNRVINVNDELWFSISISEILSLDKYLFVSPINHHFNMSFSRIYTTKSGLLADLLLCVGGQNLDFGKIKKANETLFDTLDKLIRR
jgi:hypothetical protein